MYCPKPCVSSAEQCRTLVNGFGRNKKNVRITKLRIPQTSVARYQVQGQKCSTACSGQRGSFVHCFGFGGGLGWRCRVFCAFCSTSRPPK